MKNKYAFHSRISAAKIRAIIRCFSADLTAVQTSGLTGVNRNTVHRIYRGLRAHPDRLRRNASLINVVEVDEGWFGARRVKGKRGHGAYGKTTVFGIFERDGKVYT